MTNTHLRGNGGDWLSQLFNRHGRANSGDVMQKLDREAFNFEQIQHEQLDQKDKQIRELQLELSTTKDKLKKLTESRFKSAERELAVADSTIIGKYQQVIGHIKSIVLDIIRSSGGNPNDLLKAMLQSPQYQENLLRVLHPNITIDQFIKYFEALKSPPVILACVIRAIIIDVFRRYLFNNVFICVGGEEGGWEDLRRIYYRILGSENGSEDFHNVSDEKTRRDASLWRSQTLITLDRNAERLGLKEARKNLLQKVQKDIQELLTPLVQSQPGRTVQSDDIASLVDSAANLAILLGKMRAKFELRPKSTQDTKFVRGRMEALGPYAGVLNGDDEEVSPDNQPQYDIVAVIAPALYKFGNDDGENFGFDQAASIPQVLVIESDILAKLGSDPQTITAEGDKSSKSAEGGIPLPGIFKRVPTIKDEDTPGSQSAGQDNTAPPVPDKDPISPITNDVDLSKDLPLVEPKVRLADIEKKDGQKVKESHQKLTERPSEHRSSRKKAGGKS